MTILLVDDSDSVITIWKHFLEPLGYIILEARNIQEAILKMQTIPPPDLVLLDLVLPPHSPSETAQSILTLKQFNPDLVVIAVSGLDKNEILKIVSGFSVHAAISKEEIKTQKSLLMIVREALSKSPKSSSEILSEIQDIIEKLSIK